MAERRRMCSKDTLDRRRRKHRRIKQERRQTEGKKIHGKRKPQGKTVAWKSLIHCRTRLWLAERFCSLFVYCDVVEPTVVGDFKVPLLRTVNIDGRGSLTVSRVYQNIQYVPLHRKQLDTIEIDVRDDFGRKVPFQRGKMIVTLHFRLRKPDYFWFGHEGELLLQRWRWPSLRRLLYATRRTWITRFLRSSRSKGTRNRKHFRRFVSILFSHTEATCSRHWTQSFANGRANSRWRHQRPIV